MSAAPARHLRPAPSEAPRRAPLRAVEPRFRPRPNLLRAVVVLFCVGAIFAGQLALSILVSSGAYEIAALEGEQKQLDRTAEALREQLETLSSTQHLADNAVALGMVQGVGAAYLRLSDGAVIPAPGATPRYDCTGSCGLVANDLLIGVPLATAPVAPPASTVPTTGTASGTAAGATGAAAGTTAATPPASATAPVTGTPDAPATGTIPAPVTR